MKNTDRRESPPSNKTLEEYSKDVIKKLPCSGLTYRESWAIKEYIKALEKGKETVKDVH